MPFTNLRLSSLTQWSQEHIGEIFESRSDADAMLAIDQTFATSLKGTINGKDLSYDDVKQLVRAVRDGSPNRSLRVKWQNIVEAPSDPKNRTGTIEGSYVIHGIFKTLPGYDHPVQFKRHKIIAVRIESSSNHDTTDSRRIVELTLMAKDQPEDDQTNKSKF